MQASFQVGVRVYAAGSTGVIIAVEQGGGGAIYLVEFAATAERYGREIYFSEKFVKAV